MHMQCDADGGTDGADSVAWQQQLGFGPSRASGSNDASAQSSGGGLLATGAAAGVPEPTPLVLTSIALISFSMRLRRPSLILMPN